MTIAKITGPGLAAISAAVALLWGCVISERAIVRRTLIERAIVMRDMQRLQRRRTSEPVSLPSRRTPRTVRVTAG